MSFKKGTNVLTLDGWVRIQELESGDRLWGGGGTTKITKVVQKTNTPLRLTGKGGFKLECTPTQILQLPDDYVISASKCLNHPLEFIQMGEEKVPVFDKSSTLKSTTCYDIYADGGFYVRVADETGIYIIPYL